jgi:hypothetical protein
MVNYPSPKPSTRFGAQTSIDHYALSKADGLNDGHWHVFSMRRVGRTVASRIDGTKQGELQTDDPDDVSAPHENAYLGGHPIEDGAIVQQLDGDIAFVLLARAMTLKRQQEIESQLAKRFHIDTESGDRE